MSYQVLARKWRPKQFQTLVGQEHVLQTLINALDLERIHHAYLFTGTRGVGKTTLARIFAKCLNCEQGIRSTPCDVCDSCIAIDTGSFIDLIEVDAASRTKVEDTRELLDNVQYAPSCGRYKVYLIDEVHMLSSHSFNALLKTLEEPPEHVKFLLATTDPQRLPVTVLSRCLQFHLKNLSPEQIHGHLNHVLTEEKIGFATAATMQLAKAANGSVRDALSLLDQAISFSGEQLTEDAVHHMLGTMAATQLYELVDALVTKDAKALLDCVAKITEQGRDFNHILEELIILWQRIAIAQALPDAIDEQYEDKTAIVDYAQQFSPEDIQLYYQISLKGRQDLQYAPSPCGGFEMTLLRLMNFIPISEGTNSNTSVETATKKSEKVSKPEKSETPKAATTKQKSGGITKSTHAEEWETLLKALGLSGPVLALLSYCELKSLSNTDCHLLLARSQAPMLSPIQSERITTAFSEHFGRTMAVNVELAENEVDSPAARKQQRDNAKRQAVKENLENNPQVQELVKQFDGEIDEESIQLMTVEE